MKKYLPAIISSLLFTIYFIWQINVIIENNSGKFIYPLDDTYIHLSIAKNIAVSHNFGITPHEFSSSSSSPLYTLLIAFIISVFGNNDLIPLYINYLTSILLFFTLTSIFSEKYKILSTSILVFITALILPVCILAVSGMEHLLQILINIILFQKFFKIINSNTTQSYSSNIKANENKLNKLSPLNKVWIKLNSDYFILFLFSSLSTSIRYEGIFIIFLFMLISILNKDYKLAVGLLVFSSLPIIIYGVFSTINGSFFVPNSVLFKGTKPKKNLYSLIIYPFTWVYKLFINLHLLSIFVILIINLVINIKNKIKLFDKVNYELLFVISLFIIHLTFARTGWVYRYEAYCIALGLIVIVKNLYLCLNISYKEKGLDNNSNYKTSTSRRISFGAMNSNILYIIILIIALIPLIYRTYLSFSETKLMSQNIYQQQYQMARFLNSYYNDSKIVMNDIGACTYYTNIHLIDINCLGSIETLKMKIKNTYDKEHIFKLTNDRNYDFAILYKESYKDYIPGEWIETAKLTIPHNIGCAYDNVTFYAINPNKLIDLKTNLFKFKNTLPKDVKLSIY